MSHYTICVLLFVSIIMPFDSCVFGARNDNKQSSNQDQTLAGFDKFVQQLNDGRLNQLMDPKIGNNMSVVIGELTSNFQKVLADNNKRITDQLNEMMQKARNATQTAGVNATNFVQNFRKQASRIFLNSTNDFASLNISNIMPKIQNLTELARANNNNKDH